jgi:opacity protein-like surface antigen
MSFLRNASLAVAAAVALVSLSSPAFADFDDRRGLYLSGTAGYTVPDDPDVSVAGATGELDLDDGFAGTAAVGWNIRAFRVEAEAGYRINDFELNFGGPGVLTADGDLEALSGMANLFYDFAIGDRWSIYIGGGVGAAYTTVEVEDETENDTVLAFQGMVGVGYAMSDDLTLTVGYRAFTTDDYEFDEVDVDGALYHTAEIGLRWDL